MNTLIKKFDKISGIYGLIGALLGSLIYIVTIKLDIKEMNKMYLVLVLMVFFISNLLLIKTRKGEDEKIKVSYLVPSLGFSAILSLIYYLIAKTNVVNYINGYHNTGSYITYLNFSLLVFYVISILYAKSYLSSENKKLKEIFSYKSLAAIFAKYNFTIASSFLSLGATWFILFLWSMLFKLIDINFFNYYFFDTAFFPMVLSAVIFFISFSVVNKKEWVFHKLLSVLSSFQVFLELISAFLILFMIFLPIMGPQKIFSTGYSSIIMLLLNTIGLVLIQFINLDVLDISKFRKWLITIYIALQPVFSILAFYSIMIRINQYGFTPDRFMVFIIVLIFNIFNLIYLFMVIKHKIKWREFLNKVTPYLIPISIFMVFLTLTPILNPYEISVKSQIFKYENNIEKIDLIALKFKLSKPGKLAFENLKLKYKNNKKAMKEINKVDKCNNYWNCRDHSNSLTTLKHQEAKPIFNIYPQNEKLPENFKEVLIKLYSKYYYKSYNNLIIKDFLSEYEGKEIIVFNNVWINSTNYLYQGVIVKENNKYILYKENIIRDKKIEDIDFSDIEIIKEDNYKIKLLP